VKSAADPDIVWPRASSMITSTIGCAKRSVVPLQVRQPATAADD
jgi:hypothetical protein